MISPDDSTLSLWTKQLYKEYEQICYMHHLPLKPCVIELRILERQLGYWNENNRSIVINTKVVVEHDWQLVLVVLKHEMAHQAVLEVYQTQETHGPIFTKICKQLALPVWASKSSMDLSDYKNYLVIRENNKEDRILRLIQKLLALSTSANEHEAIMAMKRVKELCRKYDLDWKTSSKEVWHSVVINHNKKRIESFKVQISSILCEFFSVQAIYTTIYNSKTLSQEKVVELFGTDANVKISEYVYWFLLNNLELLWRQNKQNFTNSGISEKHSYFSGVLKGFVEIMRKKDFIEPSSDTDNSLIIAEKKYQKQLREFVKSRYPKIRTTYSKRKRVNFDCFSAGKKDGQKLDIRAGLAYKSRCSDVKLI